MPDLFPDWIKKHRKLPKDLSMADERVRKLVMFYFMALSGIVFLLLLGIVSFLEQDYRLGILDLTFIIVLMSLVVSVSINRNIDRIIDITLSLVMLFYLTLFTLGTANNQSTVWYYTYPIITLFLVGSKKGTFFSLLLFSLTALISLLSGVIPFYVPYPPGFIMRLLFSYLLVLILMSVYEYSRKKTEKRLEETLKELQEKAIRDSLTNLYNRRHMDEVWALVLRQKHQKEKWLSFFMIDLDLFKNYNDNYGHQMGDEVLRRVSKILSSLIRRKSDYVFRYGGEEFSVLLYGTDKATVETLAETIINEIYHENIPH